MNRFFHGLFAAFGIFFQTFAQTVPVTGTVRDGTGSNGPLIGVTVLAIADRDSTRRTGAVTDTAGHFRLDLPGGSYRLRVSFVGYQPLETSLRVNRTAVNLGVLRLVENAKQLREVTVVGQQLRVETKGDTLQFNAGAFKTNPDANAEDLVRKLPGITIENGTVKTQGEDVKRVLIDGKPFFGDDPSLALRNLPAEVIDKIQVFDRLSDQSQFSGFDDGNGDKTINIITRSGRNNGQFGKIYAGVGTDGRYQAGANVNFFNGDRRISLLGLSNNINQQNFATQDLLGALGGGSGGGRQGGGRQRGGGGPRGGGGAPGGPGGGGGGNAGNFLVGQQGGITSTNAFGLNYSDTWGPKATVTGSYFFNDSRNLATTLLNRTYFASRGQNQVYDETEQNSTNNLNHRANFRLEYKFNPKNSLIVTPSMSWQNTRGFNAFDGANRLSEGALLSRTSSENTTASRGYTFSNNVLFQHRFAKQGRTFSVGVSTSANDRTRDNRLRSLNEFFGTTDSTFNINQESNSLTTGYTLGANLSYTEPLGKQGQLQLTYNPSFTDGFTEKKTYNVNGKTSLDTTLSNTFASQYLSQRAGGSYRFQGKVWQVSAGLFYQNATLSGDQSFPRPFEVRKTFVNLLPNVQVNFRPSRQQNLRINYRAATNFPSVNQLQNVIDNSNPLQLTAGNPDLKQEYSHQFTARYNRTNPETARSFFFLVSGNLTQANITNTTFLAQRDTVLANRGDGPGVPLYSGSQLTRPVNLDGYRTFRSFLTYGLPASWLKSNLNFNLGYAYTRLPGLVNDVLNLSNTSTFNGGLVLSSSASENLDFTFSYAGNYNLVRNSIRPQLNANYFFHAASARVNWIFGKGFLLNSDLTNTLYRGLGEGFDQNFVLWNVSFGKKFLKDRRGELKVTVFDLLRQNNSIARNVTETYVDDTQTQVLQQYAMATFTYTFRNFIK